MSPEQRGMIRNKRIYSTIKEIITLFILFACLISVFMIVSRDFLQEQLQTLVEQNSSDPTSSQKIGTRIAVLNRQISDATSVQKDFKKWSALILAINTATTKNIAYTSFHAYGSNLSVEISGTATTRDDLLKLKESLTASGLFLNIDLPLSDLLAKGQNSFHIKATFDKKKQSIIQP
ncbi:MAG: hypothetical protein WCP18_00550 [bacterium]